MGKRMRGGKLTARGIPASRWLTARRGAWIGTCVGVVALPLAVAGNRPASALPAPPLPPLPPVRPAASLPLFFDELGPNRFARPALERTTSSTTWLQGRFGWSRVFGGEEFGLAHLSIDKIGGTAPLWPPEVDEEPRMPLLLPALPTLRKACPTRSVLVIRYGAEAERFPLLDCNGAVADGALDRLSVLARPPDARRPELPLPDEPQGADGEWVDGVKMVPPRVVWLLSQLAKEFPWRAVYLYSGYRPVAGTSGSARGRSSHAGLHADARALDIAIHGIPTTRLYEACRKLPDTGCGYYPNHPFVHVDVRRPGLVRAAWIDTSFPGQPSVYVRSWPGVADADVVTGP
jgi:hypothetical protein